jgi:hypothetical protein
MQAHMLINEVLLLLIAPDTQSSWSEYASTVTPIAEPSRSNHSSNYACVSHEEQANTALIAGPTGMMLPPTMKTSSSAPTDYKVCHAATRVGLAMLLEPEITS